MGLRICNSGAVASLTEAVEIIVAAIKAEAVVVCWEFG